MFTLLRPRDGRCPGRDSLGSAERISIACRNLFRYHFNRMVLHFFFVQGGLGFLFAQRAYWHCESIASPLKTERRAPEAVNARNCHSRSGQRGHQFRRRGQLRGQKSFSTVRYPDLRTRPVGKGDVAYNGDRQRK